MADLTTIELIELEQTTLDYWLAKAKHAEKVESNSEMDAVENRVDALYARDCVGIQKLKILQLEKEYE